jgi:hypothetical protein
MSNQRDILEKQIIEDANQGDTTVLAELLNQLSDTQIYGALDDNNQAKVVDPKIATSVPEFKDLCFRAYGNTKEVIAVEEDDRCIGTSQTESGVFDVISNNNDNAEVKLISVEWRKHNNELVVNVEVTEENGDVVEKDYLLRTA